MLNLLISIIKIVNIIQENMSDQKDMNKNSRKEDKHQYKMQAEKIAVGLQDGQSMSSSSLSQQSDQSCYRQRQVFYIPQNLNQNPSDSMEAQQAEAFQYLISVRQETQGIKERQKQLRRKHKKEQKHKNSEQKICQQPKFDKKKQQPSLINIKQGENGLPNWFSAWQQESLASWNCIVENFKYLHKNPQILNSLPTNSCKPLVAQSNSKLIKQKPLIGFIGKLTLSQVEQLIQQLSQLHYHSSSPNYYLWIYSLLAAHRAHASYWSFQALASINSCLLLQEDKNVKNSPHNCEKLVICCLMQKQFRQIFGKKINQLIQNTYQIH